MIGIELVKDESKSPDPGLLRSVRTCCRKNGVLVGGGGIYANVLRIQPPLVISDAQLERVAAVVERSLRECA